MKQRILHCRYGKRKTAAGLWTFMPMWFAALTPVLFLFHHYLYIPIHLMPITEDWSYWNVQGLTVFKDWMFWNLFSSMKDSLSQPLKSKWWNEICIAFSIFGFPESFASMFDNRRISLLSHHHHWKIETLYTQNSK